MAYFFALLLGALSGQIQPGCETGYRVQIIYAYDQQNRFTELSPYLWERATAIDAGFGGYRKIRFACDIIPVFVDRRLAFNPFAASLAGKGHRRTDRKYLVFADYLGSPCGVARSVFDDSPGQGNLNNVGPGYAVLWHGCWEGTIPAHEFLHMLGAAQPSAPHYTTQGHVADGDDVLLPGQTLGSAVCPGNRTYDCNGDDYYHPNPAPGSYLATHWNVASSRFLDVTEPPPLPPKFTIYIP